MPGSGVAQPTQFQIPLTFTAASGDPHTTILMYGVSGDGPGGTITDNTYGVDLGPTFGLYEEFPLPPAPPTPIWDIRWVDSRVPPPPFPNGLDTGLEGDYHGFTSVAQVDSHKVQLIGSDLQLTNILVSWPSNLSDYATSLILKSPFDLFPQVDMLAQTSVSLSGVLASAGGIYIIQSGAFVPIPCGDITSIAARCIGGGIKTIQVRVNLLNSTIYAGQEVTISIDENQFTSIIFSNGTHSRASFSVAGWVVGDHVVSLVDPPGCLPDKHATCVSGDGVGKADPEWDEGYWGETASVVPQSTELLGNYPNPFNPSTSIQYALSKDTHVILTVFNMLGQRVVTLVNDFQSAGYKTVVWDGRNDSGSPVASGLYIYTMKAGSVVKSNKLMLLK
jgi:hypothetical protein